MYPRGNGEVSARGIGLGGSETEPPPGTLKRQYILLYFDLKLTKPIFTEEKVSSHLVMLDSRFVVILKVNIAFIFRLIVPLTPLDLWAVLSYTAYFQINPAGLSK